jgi:hypothetical protein
MASPRANQSKHSRHNPRSKARIDSNPALQASPRSLEIDLQAAGEVVRMPAACEPFQGPSDEPQRPSSPRGYEAPVTALQQRNTARLLPARYSDSVLNRLADTADDLQAIFELDNATNDRLIAEANGRLGITARELVSGIPYARIINAAFAHPHPQGARFSTPFRGAWYAGFELATAKAEVLFHRSIQLAEIQWHAREDLDYDHYQADFAGAFHDLRPGSAGSTSDERKRGKLPEGQAGIGSEARSRTSSISTFPAEDPWQRTACLDPDSYRFSQELAAHLMEVGSLGVIYPSARRTGGTCLACFRPGLVANVRKREMYRMSWFPDQDPVFVRVSRTDT